MFLTKQFIYRTQHMQLINSINILNKIHLISTNFFFFFLITNEIYLQPKIASDKQKNIHARGAQKKIRNYIYI